MDRWYCTSLTREASFKVTPRRWSIHILDGSWWGFWKQTDQPLTTEEMKHLAGIALRITFSTYIVCSSPTATFIKLGRWKPHPKWRFCLASMRRPGHKRRPRLYVKAVKPVGGLPGWQFSHEFFFDFFGPLYALVLGVILRSLGSYVCFQQLPVCLT